MELDYKQLNGLSLAYIGDAIYELHVRNHLLHKGLTKVNELQRHSRRYVSAKAHAAIYKQMERDSILTEEELVYFKRGRNANSHTKAKNTDVVTYRISTGLEALFGYLYLSKQENRIEMLMNMIYEWVETDKLRDETKTNRTN